MNQRKAKRSLFSSRLGLVLMGICLGWTARLLLGGPEPDPQMEREFHGPVIPNDQGDITLTSDPNKKTPKSPKQDPPIESGLVPPITLPGQLPSSGGNSSASLNPAQNFTHDPGAHFHAHGDEVCASGCAASNHPTEELTVKHFKQLLAELEFEPMNRTNNALEALLYFGPQTKVMLVEHGYGSLEKARAEFLWRELAVTHARISIRVVDQHGEVRTWIEPTVVPFDRRHVFEMETKNLQPLVMSGTVKRVGLDHLWTRL